MKDQQKAQVLKLMKTMINRGREDKEAGWRIDDNLHNSAITAADCYSVIQDIGQGVDGSERVGDRIKPKSLVVRGDICINPGYNPDTRVMYVRVIIASQKNVKQSAGGALPIDTDHLLRPALVGGPLETNFNGTVQALRYPVNNNKFRVYMDKVFKLVPTSQASGFPLVQSQFSFKKVFKQLPSSLTYDQGGGDYCNNFAPFLAVGYCYADGGAPDTINQRVLTKIWSQLTYEDA